MGIGLVEVIWKMITSIMKICLRATISLNDNLHGFKQGRGMDTYTLEAKLNHQMAGIRYEPLPEVFLDVKKVYDLLDRSLCMEILRG